MGLASGRRAHGASRRLLAWGAALLLLAVFVRPLFPPADAPIAFQDASGDYSLDAFVPEQPFGVEAKGDALAERIQAGDGFGALVPAAQSTPSPKVQFAAADRPPEDPPPPRAAVSPRLTTGPPRLKA